MCTGCHVTWLLVFCFSFSRCSGLLSSQVKCTRLSTFGLRRCGLFCSVWLWHCLVIVLTFSSCFAYRSHVCSCCEWYRLCYGGIGEERSGLCYSHDFRLTYVTLQWSHIYGVFFVAVFCWRLIKRHSCAIRVVCSTPNRLHNYTF